MAPPGPMPGGPTGGRRPSAAAALPRPKMVGTVLPQDSLRGRRASPGRNRGATSLGLLPFGLQETQQQQQQGVTLAAPLLSQPPPPPSQPPARLLAAAGLDLFRQGLAFDGLRPTRRPPPRHPAVTPTLNSIPEDTDVRGAGASMTTPAVLIVVLGGRLNDRGEPGPDLATRIARAIQLYWQTTLSVAEAGSEDDEASATPCYLVPTAAEDDDDAADGGGVVEIEAIRHALVGTGISPHHILTDCTAPSVVDNAVQLLTLLRHFHAQSVHVVAAESQLPRVRESIDQIVRAHGPQGTRVLYHGAPEPGLSGPERAERALVEAARHQATRQDLTACLARLALQRGRPSGSSSRSPPPRRPSKFQSDV